MADVKVFVLFFPFVFVLFFRGELVTLSKSTLLKASVKFCADFTKVFWMRYKTRPPMCICMQKDNLH